ncbi:hypothetical protein ACJROX_17145 [Pseudalkalibacillus sp. A8]|uniref:hypothetical protein n=1 Tax=Pseudalkalibacillus sp. A8 TaxID=3382641 RepID=UPI0038B5ECF3
MEQVGFYLVGLIFWLLIGLGLLLTVWGLWKKSWLALLISGVPLILPCLSFMLFKLPTCLIPIISKSDNYLNTYFQ